MLRTRLLNALRRGTPQYRTMGTLRLQPLGTVRLQHQLLQKRHASGLSTLVRDYGTVAVGTYLTMSFTFFCGCLGSIYFLGVTSEDVKGVFDKLWGFLGYEPSKSSDSDSWFSKLVEKLPEWAKTPQVMDATTNILLALGMTKLFVPVKLAITASIVPSVARFLRARKWIK
ncbi:hypothetical protein EDD86DRAFT_203866 [Gorgonomyces haynaldii]|nr:hypothetical protein EDD86DRAFT_203866 [Gorgonomyces haynaldii]